MADDKIVTVLQAYQVVLQGITTDNGYNNDMQNVLLLDKRGFERLHSNKLPAILMLAHVNLEAFTNRDMQDVIEVTLFVAYTNTSQDVSSLSKWSSLIDDIKKATNENMQLGLDYVHHIFPREISIPEDIKDQETYGFAMIYEITFDYQFDSP